jgi:hypothetical protein
MEIDKNTKKQNYLLEKDTANVEFSQILKKKKKSIIELTIDIPLYGNLNLSLLSDNGFTKIEILIFSEGSLTTITNIPSSIRVLIASNQILNKIDLPDDLEHLEIENNLFVGEFSLKNQRRLNYINVSFNKIRAFENNLLPETLEELYCDHNLLKNLYLGTCPKLRVLHCENNHDKLKIHNLPDTVLDIKIPEKAIKLDENKKKQTEDENENAYQDSLKKYFHIKQMYEKSLKEKKNNKSLPKCYGCNKNVGMIFSGKNQKYTARCGDSTKPCGWKLILHRGENYIFRDTFEEMRKTLEETKENIIRQKMDTLFDYIPEEKSVALFKKHLSLFKINSEMVNKYRGLYEDMYFNVEKQELLQQKRKKIQEIRAEIQEKIDLGEIKEVVELQMKIKGISEYIQRETYEYMEMIANKNDEFRLEQENVEYSKLEINHGEPVKVE